MDVDIGDHVRSHLFPFARSGPSRASVRGGPAEAAGAGRGGTVQTVAASRFVVQLHDATALHFDLRIQAGGVLRSWAGAQGPLA
jgi:hypothetical protein